MLEFPALAVGLEGVIEKFAAHHRFTQDVERCGRFAVRIVAELGDAFAVGHDRFDPALLAFHVIDDVARRTASAGIIVVPFLFGEVLHEGVQAFIHPRPLPLIAVDDHGEEVVAHFVDDHTDHAVLDPIGIGAVLLRPPEVETDHGVLHPDPIGVHTDRHGVRIIDRVLAVGLHGVRHHLGAVALPKWIAFLRIEAHAQHVLPGDRLAHAIPDELSAAGEGEIAHVLRMECPGFLFGGTRAFVGQRFFGRYDQHRLFRCSGLRQSLTLC